MKFIELKEIIDKNNISYDVELLSDSGWECSETAIGSLYYNKEDNIIVCRQEGNKEEIEYNNKKYVLIYFDENYWKR